MIRKNLIFSRLMLLLVGISFFISSCDVNEKNSNSNSNEETQELNLISEIKTNESKLFSGDKTKLNDQIAKTLVAQYKEYAQGHPGDSLSANFLFKAGDLSIGIKEYNKAISIFERLCTHYPDFHKAPEALYIQGFVYENYLNQKGKAEEVYLKVIKEFPSHKLAEDANAAIENLGLSNEELIKKFKLKNGK